MLNNFEKRFLCLQNNKETSVDDCIKLLDDVIASFNKEPCHFISELEQTTLTYADCSLKK